MKRINRIFLFFYKCFALYTLVVYALLIWFPFKDWFSGFIMMTFPVVIIVHLFCLISSLLTNKQNIILPVVLLAVGCIFLPRTYSYFNNDAKIETGKKPFKVMSYNVHAFRHNSDNRSEEAKAEIRDMQKWISGSGADVLCMFEYFSRHRSPLFNSNKVFENNGYKHVAYLNRSGWNRKEDYWGLVIYSKLPIISVQDTLFMAQNGMISADVKVGKDTVRIVALHLYSMTLQLDALSSQRTLKGIWSEGRENAKRIKTGFINHADEMSILESWIKGSPHPVIVCGDFNETPYSYVYGKSRSLLANSFEDKGKGFGFTFNGLPYFIRIDNQFYSEDKINLLTFKTINTVQYSDHYPILGTYQIKKK